VSGVNLNDGVPWELLGRTSILKTPHIEVSEDVVRLPSGVIIDDFSVVDLPDGVMIVATDEKDRLITFREYKHAANKYLLLFPGGQIDEGETPSEAAIRELREETGYESVDVEYIAPLQVHPSKLIHINHIVRIKNARYIGAEHHETTESIGPVELVELDNIAAMQEKGDFNATYLLAALALTLPEYLRRV
jgi:ADP-ribose pyrophosphatase